MKKFSEKLKLPVLEEDQYRIEDETRRKIDKLIVSMGISLKNIRQLEITYNHVYDFYNVSFLKDNIVRKETTAEEREQVWADIRNKIREHKDRLNYFSFSGFDWEHRSEHQHDEQSGLKRLPTPGCHFQIDAYTPSVEHPPIKPSQTFYDRFSIQSMVTIRLVTENPLESISGRSSTIITYSHLSNPDKWYSTTQKSFLEHFELKR